MTEKLTTIKDTAEFQIWFKSWQKMINDYISVKFPSGVITSTLEISIGRKYIKVISNNVNQRSVMAFVDNKTGDIYKPAGWKSPAKHIRGSIFDQSKGMGCVGVYGVTSLR